MASHASPPPSHVGLLGDPESCVQNKEVEGLVSTPSTGGETEVSTETGP
jgi:hypothetical protein